VKLWKALILFALVPVGVAVGLGLGSAGTAGVSGTTYTVVNGNGHGTPGHDPFPICHATGSTSHPFVYIKNIDISGVWSGHVQHQDNRDIINAFTIVDKHGKVIFDLPNGQNLGTLYNGVTGAVLLAHHCVPPKAPVASTGTTTAPKGTTTQAVPVTTTVYSTTTVVVPATTTAPPVTVTTTKTVAGKKIVQKAVRKKLKLLTHRSPRASQTG
jgi:hypothetical protein